MVRIETVTGRADRRRRGLLVSQLRATNTQASPVMRALRDTPDGRETPLQVWALAEDGANAQDGTDRADDKPAGPDDRADEALVAGLDARTWGRWLHIDLLWVDARHRRAGLGARLLATAEQIAREERGCRHARVCTWDFQAPDFYQRYGYAVVCAIPDYPPGATEYTLTKRLD